MRNNDWKKFCTNEYIALTGGMAKIGYILMSAGDLRSISRLHVCMHSVMCVSAPARARARAWVCTRRESIIYLSCYYIDALNLYLLLSYTWFRTLVSLDIWMNSIGFL